MLTPQLDSTTIRPTTGHGQWASFHRHLKAGACAITRNHPAKWRISITKQYLSSRFDIDTHSYNKYHIIPYISSNSRSLKSARTLLPGKFTFWSITGYCFERFLKTFRSGGEKVADNIDVRSSLVIYQTVSEFGFRTKVGFFFEVDVVVERDSELVRWHDVEIFTNSSFALIQWRPFCF